jgi:hypothetical protein
LISHKRVRRNAARFTTLITGMEEKPPRRRQALYSGHKGVDFFLTESEPGLWLYSFIIADMTFKGSTKTQLEALAIRRVRVRIDRELKRITTQREKPDRTQ